VKPKKSISEASHSETAAFEKALGSQPSADHYLLRLYVTGTTPRSARAIQNIRALCEEKLHGRYDLEVVDIYQHPEQATPEQVVVTPTLVKKLPLPVRRLIGDLSNAERVLVGLDIVPREIAKPKKDGNAS
jgi:circadian clock protein KaiB